MPEKYFRKKKIQESISKVSKLNPKIKLVYLLVFVFILPFLFLIVNILNFQEKNTLSNIEVIKKSEEVLSVNCENCFYRLIDGKEVFNREDSTPFLIAVVIDNHFNARPTFGLSQAELVYDIPAEGGINRYLAFFAVDEEELGLEIGPIRSARPYFLYIAKEYDAMLIHCGGSPEALAMISKNNLLSLNEFYNSKYFRRYKAYKAPHNVLANFDLIKEYLEGKNYKKSTFDSWEFSLEQLDKKNLNNSQPEITITNNQNQYIVKWRYDPSEFLYFKYLNDKKYLDSENKQISASNIILHFVETKILDRELRLQIELLGKNRAVICIQATCQEGYWKKEDKNSRTKYYYETGEEVVFDSGKTWIHFVDKNTNIKH